MERLFKLMLIIALFLAFQDVAYAANKTGKIVPEAEVKKRYAIADEWISAGDKVAKDTKNEKAAMVMDLINSSKCLAIPIYSKAGHAISVYCPKSDNYTLYIVPMIEKDAKAGQEWKNTYYKEVLAELASSGDMPFLVLKERKMTKKWMGLLVIHEGTHAHVEKSGFLKGINDPLEKRVITEVIAYDLEVDLVEKIGGAGYKKLLKKEIERLKKDYVKNEQIILPDYLKYDASLEEIFGKNLSREEAGARGTVFWINAVFRLIEGVYKNRKDIEKRKIDFLYTMYKNGNMR